MRSRRPRRRWHAPHSHRAVLRDSWTRASYCLWLCRPLILLQASSTLSSGRVCKWDRSLREMRCGTSTIKNGFCASRSLGRCAVGYRPDACHASGIMYVISSDLSEPTVIVWRQWATHVQCRVDSEISQLKTTRDDKWYLQIIVRQPIRLQATRF